MTATPIPRTVAMTLFGDLDVSTLATVRPAGRRSTPTWRQATTAGGGGSSSARSCAKGGKAIVIAPLVEESETGTPPACRRRTSRLANGELAAFRLGLLHGRMTPAEKDAAMDAFRTRRDAGAGRDQRRRSRRRCAQRHADDDRGGERFGLAQLHQLRGRMHRGAHPGYCCVFAESARRRRERRLQAFFATTDGFELAEMDFELRGPGDLFGTRQHGLPPLRIADLRRDSPIVAEARTDAQQLVASDPDLAAPEHALLRRQVLVRYGKALDLGDVG